MRYINPRFTYLLTYLRRDKFGSYGWTVWTWSWGWRKTL